TGLHLGDVAHVQGGAAHHLDVEVALSEDAPGGFACGRERLGEQVVQGLAVREQLPVLVGQLAQLGVAHLEEVLLDRVDLIRELLELAQGLSLARTKDLIHDWRHSRRLLADRGSPLRRRAHHTYDADRKSTRLNSSHVKSSYA